MQLPHEQSRDRNAIFSLEVQLSDDPSFSNPLCQRSLRWSMYALAEIEDLIHAFHAQPEYTGKPFCRAPPVFSPGEQLGTRHLHIPPQQSPRHPCLFQQVASDANEFQRLVMQCHKVSSVFAV